jgi:hypothetical protein
MTTLSTDVRIDHAFIRGQMDYSAGINDCPFKDELDSERREAWGRGYRDSRATKDLAISHSAAIGVEGYSSPKVLAALDAITDDISDILGPSVVVTDDEEVEPLALRGPGPDADPVRANDGDVVAKVLIVAAFVALVFLGVKVAHLFGH